ncbi:MAG: RodZ domain-containing protein [Thiohalorhabdus sp.]
MVSEETENEASGFGEQLRRAREAAGWTQANMAEELRLTVEHIQALESEDFSRLPGAAYIRGYLRSYAAIVGLSPDSVIQAFEARQSGGDAPRAENDTPIIPEPERPMIEHPGRVVSVSLLLLLLVGGTTFWFVGDGMDPAEVMDSGRTEGETAGTEDAASEPEGAENSGENAEEEASAGEGQAMAEQESDAAPPPEEELQQVLDKENSGPSSLEDQGSAEAAELDSIPESPDASDSAEAGSGSEEPRFRRLDMEEPDSPRLPQDMQRLRVRTWVESWMEIKDAEDNLLLRRMVEGDETLRLYGKAPFRVKVGNAAGVQLYFDGEPLEPLGRSGQVVTTKVDASSPTIPESQVVPPPTLGEADDGAGNGGRGGPETGGDGSDARTFAAPEE